ncbi:MAG: T9SS type A sorting domain-containing protein [Bacteroidales bacterium]|nr:T9SS type A sorting domain-containing protein [Bacteroidales bacterium]
METGQTVEVFFSGGFVHVISTGSSPGYMEISDLTGRWLTTASLPPGISLIGTDYPQVIYFLRVETSGDIVTRKLWLD